MKNRKFLPVFILVLALLATGCSSLSSLSALVPLQAQAQTAVPEAPSTTSEVNLPTSASGALASLEATFEAIYTRVNPSVVNIEVSTGGGLTSFNMPSGEQQGLGSGFVWDTQGHIVTNNHVVEKVQIRSRSHSPMDHRRRLNWWEQTRTVTWL